jgi:proteasome accessory factor A
MKHRIIGVECEYAPIFRTPGGTRVAHLNGQRLLDYMQQLSALIFSTLARQGYPMAGEFLGNGGRLYIDRGGHPEYATPECQRIEDLVAHEKAGDRIVQGLVSVARRLIDGDSADHRLHILKNNADDYATTYGAHENYLVSPKAAQAIRRLIPFLVTRQIFAGTGRITTRRTGGEVAYQISQRADFIQQTVSDRSSGQRGIINTRKREIFREGENRRLHIIVGDSNMSETAIGLKVGATEWVLQLLEEGAVPEIAAIRAPVKALQAISRSWNCSVELEGRRGRYTAADVQSIYLEAAHGFLARHGATPSQERVLALWSEIVDGLSVLKVSQRNWTLEDDPAGLRRKIDWIAKLWLLNRYGGMGGASVDDRRLKLLDYKYHDLDPATGLFLKCEALGLMDRWVDDTAVARAQTHPPDNTRARLRGELIQGTAGSNVEIRVDDWETLRVRTRIRGGGSAHPFHHYVGGSGHLTIRLKDPFQAVDETITGRFHRLLAQAGKADTTDSDGHSTTAGL